MKGPPTEALYYWDGSGLNVLIPCRKKAGFLKCPLGHHRISALAEIEYDEAIDMCGLDGWLELEYGMKFEPERSTIVARVMPRLADHYGFKFWKGVGSDEFFSFVESNNLRA